MWFIVAMKWYRYDILHEKEIFVFDYLFPFERYTYGEYGWNQNEYLIFNQQQCSAMNKKNVEHDNDNGDEEKIKKNTNNKEWKFVKIS